jgi:hypothetical protein
MSKSMEAASEGFEWRSLGEAYDNDDDDELTAHFILFTIV